MSSVVDQLVKAGIDARAYARGPAGVHPFVASIDPHPLHGRLWIWEGRSEIDVATHQRHRQGVLNVSEEGREVVAKIHTPAYRRGVAGMALDFLPEHRIIENAVGQMRGRWSLPNGTKWTGRIVFMPRSVRSGSNAQVTVRALCPPSKTSLLVGMDETHHFVAQLPKFGISSVIGAHRVLKPKEARVPGTKRQGEWFFVPVQSPFLARRLNLNVRQTVYEPLEFRSSHHARVVHVDNRLFAIGTVTDDRTGRHAPLHLAEFHEVIRNREVNATAAAPQRRYWD